MREISVLGSKFSPVCEFYHFTINLAFHSPAEADCMVSNAWMFQGQSPDGGTFAGQLVQWSVKIGREMPSFFLLKEEEDNFFHNLVVYLSQSHRLNCDRSEVLINCQRHLVSYVNDVYGLFKNRLDIYEKKERQLRGKMSNKLIQNTPNPSYVLPRSLGLYTSNNSWKVSSWLFVEVADW